jgi:hypothetical protein
MRLFVERCPEMQFVQRSAAEIRQQSAAQLRWFHIVSLPELFDTNLPSIEEIEAELSRDMESEDQA